MPFSELDLVALFHEHVQNRVKYKDLKIDKLGMKRDGREHGDYHCFDHDHNSSDTSQSISTFQYLTIIIAQQD